MKLKYFLVILLVLVLFLNFMTQERFVDTLKDQLNQKIDDIIATGNINDSIHQSKIQSPSITQSDSNTLTHYSLKKDRVLLTLFYDKYNEHSLNFYDDSYKTIEHNILKLDNEIKSLKEDITNKKQEIINLFNIRQYGVKPWNMLLDNLINTSSNPYINPNLLVLEEVKCDGNDISKCIENPSVILEKKTLDDITDNISDNITTIKEISTEQPPRSETLINKLPKVILSFLKPTTIINGEIQYEYIIAEYDGIYSINEPEKPLAYHNILLFIQETLDKHLEIKETDNDVHTNKFKDHEFNNDPINSIIKAEAPLYLDYNIYKCNKCCVYYKKKL